ncbi:hypothetical protein Taro_042067 [Colocasia esculenta]|uniref:Uncharacterized protein n=1 Tax=Colocasia esculenta TaxID=4460 RepID=A0A843X1T5_COLES|nr:hypothetical protein [Colocasia esculenta]
MRLVAFDHRTLDEALSAACRQEAEMEQYLEEKKASQKTLTATFQWQAKKKAVYQAPQRLVITSSAQAMQTQAHTQAALQAQLEAQLEAQEKADVWWASLLRTRFEDGAIEVAWDEFVRLFRAKFVPEHIQDRME